MKPKQHFLAPYGIEIMLIISLLCTFRHESSGGPPVICAILYVIYKTLYEISHDINNTRGQCRLLDVVSVSCVIVLVITAFATWITGIWSIIDFVSTK